MTESGSTKADLFAPPSITESNTYRLSVQLRKTKTPPQYYRSRNPSSKGSGLLGCLLKKKGNQAGTICYIILVLAHQFFRSSVKLALSKRAVKLDLFDNSFEFLSTDSPVFEMYLENVERTQKSNQILGKSELFDPMIGKFTVHFEEHPFFRSKLRWRNDADLATYAWQTRDMVPNVNMVMTESQMPNYHATSDRSCSSSSYGVSSRDPTLLDYDVIDVTWRNDIEREKNRVPEVATQHQSSQSTTINVIESQYERDLQVLHEKGFISTLSTDESSRFEELSKAQYADFYTSVVHPIKSPAELTAYSSSAVIVNKSGSRSSFEFSSFTLPPERFNQTSELFDLEDSVAATAPTFDNVTDAYRSDATIQNTSPVLGHYTVSEADLESLDPSFEIDDTIFEAYRNNETVIDDVTSSVMEQRESMFDKVVKKICEDAVSYNNLFSWTPFDDPLPIDDSFFDDFPTAATTSESGNTKLLGRSSSPSSGFVSGESRSPSPGSSRSNRPSTNFRLYGKLVPSPRNELDALFDDALTQCYEEEKQNARRRGRQSKDNELVKKYNIPASAEELANMSHKALQTLFKDPTLTDVQRAMIKKIRRRGRNKEAARKCRERRLNQTEVTPGSMPNLDFFPPKREN